MSDAMKQSAGISPSELASEISVRANVTHAQASRAVVALFSAAGLLTEALVAGMELRISGFGAIRMKRLEAESAADAMSTASGVELIDDELEQLYEQMQNPAVREGMRRAFEYSPAELGRAAVRAAHAG